MLAAMTSSLTRRGWLRLALPAAGGLLLTGRAGWAASHRIADFQATLARLEKTSGGRLGVAVWDTGSGLRAGHRQHQRFPMCSTFKVLAVSAVLHRVDQGQAHLDRRIHYTQAQVLHWAPVTSKHVDVGMTVRGLCAAAITVSDNTAANLLLASLGGPAAVTAYARSLGDSRTRLDRTEPSLNSAIPGDPRDTTTPAASAEDLHRLLLGNALSPASRRRLRAWMLRCQTGLHQLRAGLPAHCQEADKTGNGDHGTSNDIAVIWPPRRNPVIVTAYLTQAAGTYGEQNALLAQVGHATAALLRL
jgi:beta-lactamase class A